MYLSPEACSFHGANNLVSCPQIIKENDGSEKHSLEYPAQH